MMAFDGFYFACGEYYSFEVCRLPAIQLQFLSVSLACAPPVYTDTDSFMNPVWEASKQSLTRFLIEPYANLYPKAYIFQTHPHYD